MNFDSVGMEKAVEIVMTGEGHVYMLTEVTMETNVWQIGHAVQFLVESEPDDEEDGKRFPAEPEQWTESEEDDDEQPDEDAEEIAEDPEEEDETEDEPAENEDEPAPSEDGKPSTVHQKIVDMYLAGRTIKYIAQELNKSPGTVHYHLRKEGLV